MQALAKPIFHRSMEFKRAMIRDRVKAGLANARAKGVRG
jgi:hypothetical protein